MKKTTYLTVVLSLMLTYCKAQHLIIPRFDPNFYLGDVNGAYYKDVDHYFDQFVGTWSYTEGTTTLKVSFIKAVLICSTNCLSD